jgi:NADH dehydrogenase/NADH:ubiquinone oxidoreductase subunit G
MSKKSAVLNDLQQDEIIKILLKDNSNEIINKIIFDVDTGNFTAQSIILNNQLEELQKRDMNDTNIQKEISKIKNQIYRTELFDEIGRIIKIRLNTKQPILPPKGLKKLEQLKQLHNPIEHESEKEKALQSVFSFSAPKTIQPPLPPPSESEIENNTVKEILDITPFQQDYLYYTENAIYEVHHIQNYIIQLDFLFYPSNCNCQENYLYHHL